MNNGSEHVDYANLLDISCESVSYGVSLASRTWIHRGGIVGVWFSPQNTDELIKIGRYLYGNNLPFDIIGHTSNLYFTNSYRPDFVIDTKKIKTIRYNGDTIICDCGVPTSFLAKNCINSGIQGLEGLINLPGTIAGAAVNNSSCYKCGIEQILVGIEVLMSDGNIQILHKNDMQYTHRCSAFKNKTLRGIILRVFIDASHKQDIRILQRVAEENTLSRKHTQEPPIQNLGSTFAHFVLKNNFRNFFIKVCYKLMRVCHLNKYKCNYYRKIVFLKLYHCSDIATYISNKNIGCYIWRDEFADEKFPKYIKFMNSAFTKCQLEIEIKQ